MALSWMNAPGVARGKLIYIMSAKRITSGDVLKERNGFLIHRRYESCLTASSNFALTSPEAQLAELGHRHL